MYLGIEGLANVAEESRNPSKDIPRGFGGSLVTLMVLAAVVMVLSVGVKGWPSVVYNPSDMIVCRPSCRVAFGMPEVTKLMNPPDESPLQIDG